MDDQPPAVSILFFLAAPLVLIALWFNAHGGESTPSALSAPEVATAVEPAPALTRDERIRRFAETWPNEPDYAPVFNALDPSFDLAETETSAFDPTDEYFGLPRDEGYDLVYGYCSSCHSLRIVMQQHATLERWAELLEWMQDKQGMAEPPADDEAVLLNYLVAHFGEEG